MHLDLTDTVHVKMDISFVSIMGVFSCTAGVIAMFQNNTLTEAFPVIKLFKTHLLLQYDG